MLQDKKVQETDGEMLMEGAKEGGTFRERIRLEGSGTVGGKGKRGQQRRINEQEKQIEQTKKRELERGMIPVGDII